MRACRLILLVLISFLCCCGTEDKGYYIPPPDYSSSPSSDPSEDPSGNAPASEDPSDDGTPSVDPSADVSEDPSSDITSDDPDRKYIIVGYAYAEDGALPDPSLLTHINFSFAKIQSDYETLYIREKKAKRLKQIVALKKDNPDLKVLLSVGGWGADNFSQMAADQTHRKNFCKNCLKAVQDYGLDGIDIDWEYPTCDDAGISASSDDTRNFTLLMKDLRETLGNDRLLTMASEASAKYIDWGSALQYMDFVNIMSYDMGRPPTHNAALSKSSMTKMTCEEAVAKHLSAGVPYDKMTLGMAFFGRVDRNILKGDEMDYNEIIELTGFKENWDDDAKVPYLTSGSTMVLSYDNERSIGLKADYVKQKGLLGAMYWDIEADDSNHTLAKAISSRLL